MFHTPGFNLLDLLMESCPLLHHLRPSLLPPPSCCVHCLPFSELIWKEPRRPLLLLVDVKASIYLQGILPHKHLTRQSCHGPSPGPRIAAAGPAAAQCQRPRLEPELESLLELTLKFTTARPPARLTAGVTVIVTSTVTSVTLAVPGPARRPGGGPGPRQPRRPAARPGRRSHATVRVAVTVTVTARVT